MQKLAHKMRNGTPRTNGGQHRTGQSPPCGGLPPAQTQSWGAACPTGYCTSENLAASLNRQFAGDRYPCREIPYWISGEVEAGETSITLTQNSKVTTCPTRVVVMTPDQTGALSVFEVGNQNQSVGDPIPIALLGPDSYGIIPFVTDCIKAGLPFKVTLTNLAAGDAVYVGLFGPTIG